MNLYEACIALGIWDVVRARAQVWSMVDQVAQESVDELQALAKSKFNDLALVHHPDKSGDSQEFMKLRAAAELIKMSSVQQFVDALEEEKRQNLQYFDPGSEECKSCTKWTLLQTCSTGSCSGFKLLERPRVVANYA